MIRKPQSRMSHQMAKNSSVEELENKKERIQKFLANMGMGSRRSIEELIKQKKITVNQKPIDLGISKKQSTI